MPFSEQRNRGAVSERPGWACRPTSRTCSNSIREGLLLKYQGTRSYIRKTWGENKYTNAQLPCLKRLINMLDKLRYKRWSHLHNATPPVSSPTFPQPAECFISKSIWCYQPLLTPQPQVLEMFIAFPGSCSSLSPYPQAGPTLLEISHTLQSGLLAKQEAVAGSKTHRQPGGPLHVLNGQMATNCHLPVILSIADFPCLALTVVDVYTLHVTNALTAASNLSEGPPAGFSL